MKRKAKAPHDIVAPNLRIREALRQRLEREARAHQTSINQEMNRRLEASFKAGAMRTIEDVAAEISQAWRRHRKQLEAAE